MLDQATIVLLVIVLVVIVIFIIFWGERRKRFQSGLEILLKLTSEFNSEKFRNRRKALAEYLTKSNWSTLKLSAKEETHITEIMDHFQIVGLILRRGLLDEELVYSEYFIYLEHYHYLFKEFIEYSRGIDSTIWEDAVWMFNKLMELERNYRVKGIFLGPTDETITRFLTDESNL